MEDNAYIGELLVVVVYLIAGVRLLRLAQCTGELPERRIDATWNQGDSIAYSERGFLSSSSRRAEIASSL